jgi:RNA polymerase sigma-70 factor (ECF subfamily)
VTIKKNPGLEEKLAIARLKQGDLNGMEALVRLYQVRAVSAAFLIVRDSKLAEDIVHDSFVRAAEKIHQFDESRPFGAWFLRSVVNAAIKAAKRQKRFISLDEPQSEDVSSVAEWIMDPQPGPHAVVETEETRQLVWKALGELPPEQRAAIVMRHFLEMSEAEMTQELDRPLTTVRWRLKTARNRLRKLLELFWKAENPSLEDEVQG